MLSSNLNPKQVSLHVGLDIVGQQHGDGGDTLGIQPIGRVAVEGVGLELFHAIARPLGIGVGRGLREKALDATTAGGDRALFVLRLPEHDGGWHDLQHIVAQGRCLWLGKGRLSATDRETGPDGLTLPVDGD